MFMEIESVAVMINGAESGFKKGAFIAVNGKETDVSISKITILEGNVLKIFLSSGKILNFVNYPMYFEEV